MKRKVIAIVAIVAILLLIVALSAATATKQNKIKELKKEVTELTMKADSLSEEVQYLGAIGFQYVFSLLRTGRIAGRRSCR
mgnify:CR=1 FL=1